MMYLFHTTSKTMLKKKKDEIMTYADLRSISIMPSIIMVFDKIIAPIVNAQIACCLSMT